MRKFLTTCFLAFAMNVLGMAQSNTICPFGGKVNCTGECGFFEDKNGDGYCDNGIVKLKPEDSTKTPASPKQTSPNTKINTPIPQPVDTVDTAIQIVSVPTDSTATTSSQTDKPSNPFKKPYDLIPIALVTLFAYLLSEILVKKQKIKKITHRRIWNLILLISCLVSCLLGLFLIIQINYHIAMAAFRTVRYLHVQFGIIMTIIAIIHIIWHLPYFKNFFTRKS